MAFVIVQHLDPTHKASWWSCCSAPPACRSSRCGTRQKVAPDRVYVIPPNKTCRSCSGVPAPAGAGGAPGLAPAD